MSHEWDARTYDSLTLPHMRWGRRAVERLDPAGVQRVLDAGCGTGRDTELLLDLLPGVRVVAVDESRAMLDQLEVRLAARRDRVEVVHADLARPLPIEGQVDAVISVAAFHWVPNHDVLFRNLAAVLRPGGQLAFDCGGEGNVARIAAAIEDVLARPSDVWNFPSVDETVRRLAGAGFTDLDVTLRADPACLEAGEQLESYLGTVVLGAHLAGLPERARAPLVHAVADRLPEPVIDYVRLEVYARRA